MDVLLVLENEFLLENSQFGEKFYGIFFGGSVIHGEFEINKVESPSNKIFYKSNPSSFYILLNAFSKIWQCNISELVVQRQLYVHSDLVP